MKFNPILLAFAVLFFIGSSFSFCIGQLCLFDKGGIAYIQQDTPVILTPTLTITTPVKNCENKFNTLINFSLNNVNWNLVTCMLVIDGKNTNNMIFTPLFGASSLQGTIQYKSSDDNTNGCGPHSVFVRCFNYKWDISKATEIVDSNSGTFTCTNCCAGTAPVPNLICKDNCATLTPPQYKKYTCGGDASCSCKLSDFNVSCAAGTGNASGQLCINDCNSQTQYCNSSCICKPKQQVACSAGTGITNPITQQCVDDCSSNSYCDAECVCAPKQQISCVSGVGISNETTQMCKDDCSTLGYTCESSCSCWPDMAITAETSGCQPSGSSIQSTFTFSLSPPPAAGDSYECKVKINGITYAYATIHAGQTSGTATTYLPVKQGAQWSVECTYKGRAYVSSNSQSYSCTVGCASGVGNATGALCADDCTQKLGAGYTCLSNCTCKKDDIPQVYCSAGTGNASGQVCINDCKEKLGENYFCDGQCKCQKSPPETVKCSSGTGNATGQICQNDCKEKVGANYFCTNNCLCQKNTTSISSCSANTGYAATCLDDCATLGQNYKCDINICTCIDIGGVSRIAGTYSRLPAK